MLRDIVGEQPLQLALSAWRTQPPSHDSAEAQAEKFEALLEKTSGKDLAWFFNDWVLHDRGLPSLSIVDVVPRELPAGAGHDKGWLVAVTVHNAGAAAVEVPLVIRSGEFATTKRIRVPGLSNTTERVILQNPPSEVDLNDGSVPEAGPSIHTRTVALHEE
jgi:aminopeptidase N